MLTLERSRVLDELKAVPLFRGMAHGALERLADIARARAVSHGEVLFRQGDPGDEMVVLLRGSLRVTATSAGGADLVLAVAGPGEVLGEMALLDGSARSATVTAIEECHVLSLDRSHFLALLHEQPDISVMLLVCMAQRMRHTTEHATDIAHLDVYQRILRQLRRMAAEHGQPGEEGVRISHPVPLEMLAKMVAARTDVVERLVSALEADGVLRYVDEHFLIYDVDRLCARATPLMY